MRRFLLFILITSLFACQPGKIYEENFDEPPRDANWEYEAFSEEARQPDLYLDSAGPYSGVAVAQEGLLVSPRFELNALQWYRVSFLVLAQYKAMWGIRFFSETGERLSADHYSAIDPAIDFQPRFNYFQSKADAAEAAFVLHPPQGREVLMNQLIVEKADKEEVREWQQSIMQSVPPVNYQPPAGRFEKLQASLAKLQNGEKLRVVMLGNSIMNDIGNSGWGLRVEDLYPGSELEVITSVEGGKGAGYYREEGRVASYVSRYEPGLVMIGGISQANDTAAVHDVIRQIREQMEPEPDIMLMSGPMGRQGDPRRNAAFPLQPSPDGFRRQLAGLADQTNTAYFDLKTAWGEYLASTNASYDYFLRDELHANQRGRQVLASIMADYFSPPEAKNANDPATD